MEPRSEQSPGTLQWLLLSTGVVAFIAVTGVVGMRLVRALLPKPGCCAPVPEAKANLKALYTSERAFLQEKDVYSEDMKQIGFEPEPGHRYTYFSASRAPKFRGTFETFAQTGCPLTPATLPDGTRAGLGVTLPDGGDGPGVFIGAAAANIDDDSTPDCWSIATVERVASDGTRIGPGEPYNELNDVAH